MLLDKRLKAIILRRVSNDWDDSYNHTCVKRIPSWVEKMLSFNKVFCYKCEQEIELGQHYVRGSQGLAGHVTKYYHKECRESLYL